MTSAKNWLQLSFEITKDQLELAEEILLNSGALSVTLTDAADQPLLEPLPGETPLWNRTIIVGLYEANINTRQLISIIHEQLNIQIEKIIQEVLPDKDWIRAWMEDFKPLQFGERLWICPHHHSPPEPNATNLMLDPGLAFGSGTHETTALCLQWLDAQDLNNLTVIDYGCGSGILGIASLLLGAQNCHCIDIDPQALIATMDNAIKNRVNHAIITGSADIIDSIQVDLLIANILAAPLQTLAETFASHVKIDGHLVLSGILNTQVNDLKRVYEPWFSFTNTRTMGDWALLEAKRIH